MYNYSNLKVLVVDDEPIVINTITTMLNDMKIGHVRSSQSPLEAIELMQTFTPNIILSDIEMGDIDGFEFVSRARVSCRDVNQAAIVFLTGHSNAEIINKAKALRVAGYLLKPVSYDKLSASIMRIFKALKLAGKI
ncbi:MAG: response regulator [Alphaproteobacteria bacterium]|nr:response regulator [Alphaproteobacteria bacterium]